MFNHYKVVIKKKRFGFNKNTVVDLFYYGNIL